MTVTVVMDGTTRFEPNWSGPNDSPLPPNFLPTERQKNLAIKGWNEFLNALRAGGCHF